MEGRRVHGASNLPTLFFNEELPSPSETLESLWIPSSSPTFHVSGSSSILGFENFNREEACDDHCNGFFLQPEKKRRLSINQVQFLEKIFGEEEKLEPHRKAQVAKEVGLQPRQIAIWFQNRRARYKTKQLEKDYDSLKANYDRLQSEFDDILREKEKLREEIMLLKGKLQVIDDRELVHRTERESGYDVVAPVTLVRKQEDDESDVLDSNSPHYTEAALSPDEGGESGLSFVKLRGDESSGHFGFPVEDHFFCFWP